MSTPRRRIIRPLVTLPSPHNNNAQLVHKQRHRLESARAALARWMIKLRRAFHSVEKLQRSVTRLERKITQLEDV